MQSDPHHSVIFHRLLLSGLTLLVLACGGSDGGPSGPQPGIVFVSRRLTGYPNIWLMDAGGAHQRGLANENYSDIAPALSPDGRSVAFLTNRYAAFNQVAVLDLASGNLTRVLVDTIAHGPPAWSPDGQWIAFDRSSNACCNLGGLHKIHPDGSGLTLIAHVGGAPSWSPDGSTIARGDGSGVHLVDVATGHDTLLIAGNAERPVWSPNGTKIVFECGQTLCTIGPDGAGLDTIAPGGAGRLHPGWSADGQYVYFSHNIDTTGHATNYELFRIRPDGTGLQRLTTNGDASGGAADDWPAGGLVAP